MSESSDIKAAVARQLANYKPLAQDRAPDESPYRTYTLDEMSRLQEFTKEPEVLVQNLLHRGTMMLTSGASKMKKTWLNFQLCMAIATGTPFLGHETRKGRVLVVDYELLNPFLFSRLKVMSQGLGLNPGENLEVLPLERFKWDPDGLVAFLRSHTFDFISLDPLYKLMGSRSENDSAEVAELLGEIDSVIHATGATVSITHHHRKGKLSDLSPLDRASGSGMLSRDPDTIINISPVEDEDLREDHAQLDTTLRNFPPLKPQVIQYRYPTWLVTGHNPADVGSDAKVDIVKLAGLLPDDGLTIRQWKEVIESRLRTKWNSSIRETIKREAAKGRFVYNKDGMYFPTKEVLR